ncbi:MAG: Hint domain-containing protein [Pseudomonadota bacterium]
MLPAGRGECAGAWGPAPPRTPFKTLPPLPAQSGKGDILPKTLLKPSEASPCFTPGAEIATAKGPRLVETLRPGDRVITRDNGLQPILWIGSRTLSYGDLRRAPELLPVLIRPGAMADGRPYKRMVVSPRHRFLFVRNSARRPEVLTAADRLIDGDRIRPVDVLGVSYIHLLFEAHQIVLADGVWTESFRPDAEAWRGLSNPQRLEIELLFPELRAGGLRRISRAARPFDDVPLWKRRMKPLTAR